MRTRRGFITLFVCITFSAVLSAELNAVPKNQIDLNSDEGKVFFYFKFNLTI